MRFGLKSPINSSRNCPQAKIAFRGRKLARAAADRINGRNGAEIMRHYKCNDCDWLAPGDDQEMTGVNDIQTTAETGSLSGSVVKAATSDTSGPKFGAGHTGAASD